MMNTSCIYLHFLLVLLLCCAFSSSILMINGIFAGLEACRPDQIRALEEFQNEVDSRSCNGSTYDEFYNCDNTTGFIIELEFSSGCLKGILMPNSSLFKLHHLRRLRIRNNNFKSSSLPSGFSNLNRLEVLTLSSNGFVGQLYFSFSNLSQLSHLDLSSNELTGSFPRIQNLSRLSYLDLSSNNFSGTLNPSLFQLHRLLYLDISNNNLVSSSVPYEFGNLYRLQLLNLSRNGFQGQLPSFSNLSQLIGLYLEYNEFTSINQSISQLINLRDLNLSFQNISYPIDLNVFSSLKYLMRLLISGNSISPTSLSSDSGILLNLMYLGWSGCDIHQFPNFFKNLHGLQDVDISNNKIKGKIPEWFWNLPYLSFVNLANNSFTGFEGSADVLANSTVTLLDLDLNSFEGPLPNPPHSLSSFSAWNNAFTGSIPLAICNRSFLTILDLSYNNFTGSVPRCLRSFQSSLTVLNLRKNNLEGSLPDMCNNGSLLQTIDVGYNQLTGKLQKSLLNCSSLRFLNVEKNQIEDTFPFWLKGLPNLQILILSSNKFYGPMSPPGQGSFAFPGMHILEISYNNFTGSLPSNYSDNWQASFFKKDEDGHIYMGDYNHTNYYYDDTVDLRYKGLHMEQESVLTFYATIDFSGNRLEGQIPESIGTMKALIALNLSNNAFTGHIPLSLANVTELESLDLSNNQLSGTIPKGLERLSFLAYISVAHNQLKGEIPQGTQITGQPKSSFEGNEGLCGFPLEQSCFGSYAPPMQQQPEQEKEEEEEEVLNWKAVAIGYGTGLLLGLSMAQVIASYKPEWLVKIMCQRKRRTR